MVFKLFIFIAISISCRAFKPEVKDIKKVEAPTVNNPYKPEPSVNDGEPSEAVEDVDTLKVLYIKINEVDVPTLSFVKKDPNTYVKFKACNTKNTCIRGEAYKDLHAIRNFPVGAVTIKYQTCQIKSDLSEEEKCSEIKSFATNYNPKTPEESPLSQLLGEQAILEEQMGEQARKIKSLTSHLDASIHLCKDPVLSKKIGEKEKALIKKISSMNVEDIIDALSIAGNVGELWELSKLEDERKLAEEREKERAAAQYQATKIATVNFLNGILLAGAAVGTYNSVKSVYYWQVFWRSQRVLSNDEGEKFVLVREKGSPYFQVKNNKLPGYRFLEDPFTLQVYLIESPEKKLTSQLHTGNDQKVGDLEIGGDLKFTLEGLVSKKVNGVETLFFPDRTKIDGELSFGKKLAIAKSPNNVEIRFDDSYKSNFELRKAKQDYFSQLSDFRHPEDPLKSWGKTSSFYSGSIQALSVLGAVATLLISGVFFEEGFHLKEKEHTKPCEDIIANLHKYNEEFKKAYTIYTRLLQIKIEIYMII
ncbi:MAG: hypothetical protein HRU09_04050 [Oligoflexales bacterium]|nr:hypothetical protein [Oligoflexales bacterium]